jgi:hypothetical protein
LGKEGIKLSAKKDIYLSQSAQKIFKKVEPNKEKVKQHWKILIETGQM